MDVVTLSMAKAYTDSQRLAYTEGGKIMWDVELVPMEGTGFTYFQESNTDQTVLSVGKTYTVTTDSGSFTTVCKEMSGVVFLGNGSILGITGVEDSGENFLVAVDEDHVMGFLDFNGGSRMEISTAATIHPIDQKFLPGVCLPVVELSTKANIMEAVYLSEADKTAMDDAWKKNTPCIISLGVGNMDDVLMSTFTRHSDSGYRAFNGIFYHSFAGLLAVTLEDNSADSWKILVHTLL